MEPSEHVQKPSEPSEQSNDAHVQLAEIIDQQTAATNEQHNDDNEIKLQTIGTDELKTSSPHILSFELQPSTVTVADSLKLDLHGASSLYSLSLSTNQSVHHHHHQSFNSHSNSAGAAIGDSDSDSFSISGSSETDPNQEMINASNLKLRKIATNLQMDDVIDTITVTDIDTKNTTKNATSNVKVAAGNDDCTENDSDDHVDIDAVDPDDGNLDLYQTTAQNNYFKHKWYKLLTSGMFWSRILMLILCFVLLSLSLIYCIGQLLTVKLDLITECEPKTKEEIWKHSESVWMAKHFGELDEESQYGRTTEPCWTTRRTAINTHELWHSNKFVSEWVSQINVKCVLFALLSTYCTMIILYCVWSLILDFIYVHKGILHQQSKFYEYYMMQNNNNKNQKKKKQESYLVVMFSKIRDFYQIKGWTAMSFVNEALEITLQSLSLLLYNGYNVVDANNVNDIYLAQKPKFIILFTVFLAMNCFGCGIIWLLYTLIPNKCYGLQLKFSIFFIDQFSDLFYSVFPIIIVYYDEYNNFTNLETAEKTLYVLLGQLSIDSTLVFIATFMPLFLLLNKCLFVILKSVKGTRDNYFNQWKFIQDLTKQTNDKSAAYKAQLNGFKLSSDALAANKGEIYDSNGDLILNYKTQLTKSKRKLMQSWTQQNNVKKITITFLSLAYIVYGITILIFVSNFFNKSASHCNLIKETNFFDNNGSLNWPWHNITLSEAEQFILQTTPELFLWDNCLYKVYPFQFTKNTNCKCQCRVLMIENWAELKSNAMDRNKYFNLTQHKIVMGMLNHWYMLEKFHINGVEDKTVQYSLKSSIFDGKSASAMKAFAWNGPSIVSIENGIFSKWKNLEYLKFTDVGGIGELPNDFSNLQEIKYLSFISSGLAEFDESICQLTKLKILQVESERVVSLPFCIEQLQSLQQLILDLDVALINVPLAIFSLPNLMDLSMFRTPINYQHLWSYNLANNSMDINDSHAINKWFNDNFKWNEELATDYWFAFTPICSQDANVLPSKLQTFLNSVNTVTNETVCHYPCVVLDYLPPAHFCSPLNWQNGVCDFECYQTDCFLDGGDCVQLCFMDSQLNISNCTYDKYTNKKCDEGCNNKYCMEYEFDSNFNVLNNNAADLMMCRNEDLKTYFADWMSSACWNSKSEYIEDDSLQYGYCGRASAWIEDEFVDWIGDGVCDDACRTDECSQDEADCDQECESGTCTQLYAAWTFFFGNTVYKLDHDIACELSWSSAKHLLGLESGSNETCVELMEAFDWNKDHMINFREFVVLGFDAFTDHDYEKASQVNCSKCIGAQNYNV